MTENEKRLQEGIKYVLNLLGPYPISEEYRKHFDDCIGCEGCRFEIEQALHVLDNLVKGKEADDHYGPWFKGGPVHFRCALCQKEQPDDRDLAKDEGWAWINGEHQRLEHYHTSSLRCPEHVETVEYRCLLCRKRATWRRQESTGRQEWYYCPEHAQEQPDFDGKTWSNSYFGWTAIEYPEELR